MVRLVAVPQPAEDLDGVGHAGLGHQDRLEPPFQGGILLDVLPVLVDGGGPDGVQFAAGQGRLEDVAGTHAALGRARAHDGVHLVDEHDQVLTVFADLVDDLLQPFLEVAPVPGTCDHTGQVELDQPPVAQHVGHLSVHDALGDALHDRGLAHPGIADENRVVLGSPGEHLHGLVDLVLPTDHRVYPAGTGQFGHVPGVLVQGWGARLRRATGPATTDQRGLERVGGHPVRGQDPGRTRLRVQGQREQQMFRAKVGRTNGAGDLVGVQQCAFGGRGQLGLLSGGRAAGNVRLDVTGDRVRVTPGPGDQLPGRLLPGGRPQQVLGVQVRTAPLGRLGGRVPDQFAGRFAHQPADVHPLHRPSARLGAEEAGQELVEGPRLTGSVEATGHDLPFVHEVRTFDCPPSAAPNDAPPPGGRTP